MIILTGRKHRILVFAILGIMLFAGLGEKALANGLQENNTASAKETLITAYNNFNKSNFVYIQYIKNNNTYYGIEIDHKNKIKHIEIFEGDPFKANEKKNEGNKESYIDYTNGTKYYRYSDEGPKQSKVELKEAAKSEDTSEEQIRSDEKTSEWNIDITDIDLKWKEEIGEIESLYDDKVDYIGLKNTSEYSMEFEEDSSDKIIKTYENNSYNYILNSSGFLKSVTISSGEEEITMDFEYKDDEAVVIPDEYVNVKEKTINSSEEEENTETIDNSEEDETVTIEESIDKNSDKKDDNRNLFITVGIIVIAIMIIAIITAALKKKKAKRKEMELKRRKENEFGKGNRAADQGKTDGEKVNEEDVQGTKEKKLIKRDQFKLKFTVTDNDKKKEELYYELKRGESVIVGRSDMSSVVIEDSMLSRQHFMISFDEEDLYIEDLDTTNGTMINGNKITSRTKLTQRDVVSAGNYDIRIDW